jgi:uncharacterized cupredoxin-like copper-binding protein
MRTSMLAGALLTAAAALVAGCGDTDDSSSSSETTESTAPSQTTEGSETTEAPDDSPAGDVVEVVAEDISFPDDSFTAAAGTVSFTYVNEGAIPHTLVIEDVDGFKLEVAAAGDEDEGTAELEVGTYVLFCDVPGHRDAGMEATLEVS